MKRLISIAALIAASLSLVAVADAQPITIPQVLQVNPDDLFQDIVHGVPGPGNVYAPASVLGTYPGANADGNYQNFLIGGDATTNLFQRATTGSSVTTTATYGGPDRWAYWSGTSTAMTVSRDSTAADLTSTFKYAFKMARTSGQTGVVQMCVAQEILSASSYALSGSTAEIDFHAIAGANFSSATGLKAYLITGTGTDEGMAALAYTVNAGGGAGAGWTGGAATGVTVTPSTTSARYSVVIPVPSGTTEAGVAICYTPVGTAGTNDYVALSGIQLVRNNALVSVAGSAGAALATNDPRARAFARRPYSYESLLQYAYYYQISEITGPDVIANCRSHSVTVQECYVGFPVVMRGVPTMTYTAGFATETTAAGGTLGACSALATATTVAVIGAVRGVEVGCTATTVPAAGVAGFLFNNGGSGAIKANAEL